MATTTINPGLGNTTRYYGAPAIVVPDSDWAAGMCYRPNLATSAARLWDTGGPSQPNACYARVSHPAASDSEQDFGFRFIVNNGAGVPVMDIEHGHNYPTGWPVDSDFWLIVQRRLGYLELHLCEIGGTTYSSTPAAWTLGALSPGSEFAIGSISGGGGNMLVNPYGEFFFLSGSSLSTANINTLKAGAPITAITPTPTRYYKLRESNDPEPDLGTEGADADQHGTGWTTAAEFFNDTAAAARASVQGKAIGLNRAPLANQTGITALIYHAEPSEANVDPAEVIGDLTTDADGNYDWEITRGSLVNGSDVWVIAIKDSSPQVISAMRTTAVVA